MFPFFCQEGLIFRTDGNAAGGKTGKIHSAWKTTDDDSAGCGNFVEIFQEFNLIALLFENIVFSHITDFC